MRVSYDPQDVQDIARLVAQELMPLLLAEMREAALRQPPPVARPEPPTGGQRNSASDVLSTKELQRITGLSETTLWRLAQAGQLPSKRRLSPNRVGYLRSEVDAWLESRR